MLRVFDQEKIQHKVDPVKNYHVIAEDEIYQEENLYFFKQQLNSGLIDTLSHDIHNRPNFQVANRAFYATINKFTKQNCPDTKRRSSPYSFLENWQLHRIYSKSQQTLLGVSPVKPAVVLCGDDFIFTPPSPQQQEVVNSDETQYEWNVEDCFESNLTMAGLASNEQDVSNTLWPLAPPLCSVDQKWHDIIEEDSAYNEPVLNSTHLFRTVSPSPQSSQEIVVLDNDPFDLFTDEFYRETTTETDDTSNEQPAVFSSDSSSLSSDSDDDMDNKRRSFYADDDDEENERSSYDLMNLYDTTIEIDHPQQEALPVTRSATYLSESSYLSAKSVVSYQSLADIMSSRTDPSSLSKSFCGRISNFFGFKAWAEPDSGEEGLLSRCVVSIVSFWNLLSSFVFKPSSSSDSSELV